MYNFDAYTKLNETVLCSKVIPVNDHTEKVSLVELKHNDHRVSWYVEWLELETSIKTHMPFDSLLLAKIRFWKYVLL